MASDALTLLNDISDLEGRVRALDMRAGGGGGGEEANPGQTWKPALYQSLWGFYAPGVHGPEQLGNGAPVMYYLDADGQIWMRGTVVWRLDWSTRYDEAFHLQDGDDIEMDGVDYAGVSSTLARMSNNFLQDRLTVVWNDGPFRGEFGGTRGTDRDETAYAADYPFADAGMEFPPARSGPPFVDHVPSWWRDSDFAPYRTGERG